MQLFDRLQAELRRIEARRDRVLELRQRCIREARRSIQARLRDDAASDAHLRQGLKTLQRARALAEELPDRGRGLLLDAERELGEAMLLDRVLQRGRLPARSALPFSAAAVAEALGDVAGELQRALLTRIINHDPDGAASLLEPLRAITEGLQLLDAPGSIAEVKRAQDRARHACDLALAEVARVRGAA